MSENNAQALDSNGAPSPDLPAQGSIKAGQAVNAVRQYPKIAYPGILHCQLDLNDVEHSIDKRIFGTNLEWFNNAGGLVNQETAAVDGLVNLAKNQGITVYRYPGGTLSDFYHWHDGIGKLAMRPMRKHPTDPGISSNDFGSPEFFRFLQKSNAEGLITVNAGTGTAEEAAEWVAYANNKDNSLRVDDGLQAPAQIKLWEIGNELYLPGNPGEQIVTVNPRVYADRYIKFADAMRQVDPNITLIAIGVAKSHIGPDTKYPEWTEVLLKKAANKIDMVSVHNAYFPMLYGVKQPSIEQVYPALWASPEAVKRSLDKLGQLLEKYETNKKISIAVTEWGALFSLPDYDPYWVDHVKTIGSGIYMARLLQVFISNPRVKLTNYFKLTDRSFMGWINYGGKPKVPYYVFELYAKYTGDQYLNAWLESPTFDTKSIGIMTDEKNVAEVTVVASRQSKTGEIYINLVNRSMQHIHKINLDILGKLPDSHGHLMTISANEPSAHNGRDIPPEWPYNPEYEPYTSAPADSVGIKTQAWKHDDLITLAPFSITTLVIKPQHS